LFAARNFSSCRECANNLLSLLQVLSALELLTKAVPFIYFFIIGVDLKSALQAFNNEIIGVVKF
jgi:hypothetical protein